MRTARGDDILMLKVEQFDRRRMMKFVQKYMGDRWRNISQDQEIPGEALPDN